jgi:DNA polymerase III alpha subunit
MLSLLMRNDIYGRQVLTENDLCEAYLRNSDSRIKNAAVANLVHFSNILEIKNLPSLVQHQELTIPVDKFDDQMQSNWFIPDEYKNLDIAKYVLDLCQSDAELQRVGEELILFQERDLFPLLKYCKYLVDTMRQHNVVWGVGRGSSVSSYVLFLIGIHRINSLHYDLSIDEFLK